MSSLKEVFKDFDPKLYSKSSDKKDLNEATLTEAELLEMRTSYNKDFPNYAERSYPIRYKYGNGPYPVIDSDPPLSKVLSNINRRDAMWGIACPIAVVLHTYFTQSNILYIFAFRYFHIVYHFISANYRSINFRIGIFIGLGAGIISAAVRPYCNP